MLKHRQVFHVCLCRGWLLTGAGWGGGGGNGVKMALIAIYSFQKGNLPKAVQFWFFCSGLWSDAGLEAPRRRVEQPDSRRVT